MDLINKIVSRLLLNELSAFKTTGTNKLLTNRLLTSWLIKLGNKFLLIPYLTLCKGGKSYSRYQKFSSTFPNGIYANSSFAIIEKKIPSVFSLKFYKCDKNHNLAIQQLQASGSKSRVPISKGCRNRNFLGKPKGSFLSLLLF